jgi:hypothetical protein
MATYIQIGSTVEVGSGGAASIDFTSIPSTYTDLLIKLSAKTTRSGTFQANMTLSFNGVTTNLSSRILRGLDTTPNSYSAGSAIEYSAVGDGSTATNTFGNAEIYIPNYAGSTNKSVSIDSVAEANETNQFNYLTAALWSSTSAITSIAITTKDVGATFKQYSTATLYGISKS